jgi:UDP-N-acetyl-D-mannosaminuronate dehydrogenase
MMDAVIIAVAHAPFKKMSVLEIRSIMKDEPVLIEVRGMVDRHCGGRLGCSTGSCEERDF